MRRAWRPAVRKSMRVLSLPTQWGGVAVSRLVTKPLRRRRGHGQNSSLARWHRVETTEPLSRFGENRLFLRCAFYAPTPDDSTVRSTCVRRGPSAEENPHALKGRKRTAHPHRRRNANGQCDAAVLGAGLPVERDRRTGRCAGARQIDG